MKNKIYNNLNIENLIKTEHFKQFEIKNNFQKFQHVQKKSNLFKLDSSFETIKI